MDKKKTSTNSWLQIVTKAMHDESFKKRLLHDPKKVMEEHGIHLPKEITPKIVENTKETTYFILPEKHAFSKQQLAGISGGDLGSDYQGLINAGIPPSDLFF
ncbi:MAG: NHLP leader peptide family RiPP precursor [Chlamydiales bacterium]|nr:NHLP leader peptide family RiPP precursor [Chlamydiales bacterium]